MTITAQNRAIKTYRARMRKQGLARFEVKALDSDRDLIRSLASRLIRNDHEATRIRSELRQSIAKSQVAKGGILAAFRRSPLVGVNLEIVRSTETGRDIDF